MKINHLATLVGNWFFSAALFFFLVGLHAVPASN
jgi:hypothetical protein